MAATTMDLGLLQAAASSADNIRKKIDRCQQATAAVICSFVILPTLVRMQRQLKYLQTRIGEMDIRTDEDREWAKDQALSFANITQKIESAESKYRQLIETVSPFFGFITKANFRLLDEIYCLAEDAAETLALVASQEVLESIESELCRIHGNT